jgi:hypothetical protein
MIDMELFSIITILATMTALPYSSAYAFGKPNPALFIKAPNERFMSSGGRYRPTFMSEGV